MRISRSTRTAQQGAALLLIMLAVIVATSTLLLANLSRDDRVTRQLNTTQEALAEAHTALLDYAVLNADLNPGRSISLPCPDIDDTGGFAEGEAHDTACGAPGVNVIGRLPWRTLGIPALQDVAAACLWYVVSGSHKDAGIDTAAMINTDSNGQLQLFNIETASVSEGLSAEDRPIAMIIAPMQPLVGQSRPGISANRNCSAGATATNYLDTDAISGINNALLSGMPDTIDVLAFAAGRSEGHNDRFATIARGDVERIFLARADHDSNMRSLGLAAAACIANYGASNPGGSDDRRLPWPALTALADYLPDAAYDDSASGALSGRLSDIVDDSNVVTGNGIARVLSDCDSAAVPEWTPLQFARWQNWKDHFFYAVADSYDPNSPVPSTCGICLTVNGSGQYAAVLLYANARLANGSQQRNAPPIDADTKGFSGNYLEGINAANIPGAATDFASGPATPTFNDRLFCIDHQLVVSEC